MSERTAAFGIKAPPKTIEHNGKVYAIAPVLTHGTMLAVESKLYERAKAALVGLRDAMDPAEYKAELEALRAKHEAGHYAFESPHTLEQLQTTRGALTLLSCMMSADEAEILELLTSKPDEVEAVLNEALADSFPKGRAPSLKGRGRKPKARRRR